MKTAIIWIEWPEAVKYYIINEDWSRFQGVTINGGEVTKKEEELKDELYALMYDIHGKPKHTEVTIDDIKIAVGKGASLVQCGFVL